MSTRNERILSKVQVRKSVGIELGPLTTPVVTKDQGKIFYVDHMSTADLRKKYANEPVVLNDIVEVDYVLNGQGLKSLVGNTKFDYVIASHVIEHIPDIISWLQDIASILKPGGILSLVIPDKRYTFDITRQVSRPADVVGAYIDRAQRADSATMYDFATEYRQDILAGEVISNPFADYRTKKRRYTDAEAFAMAELNASGKEYVDSHCLVFTPISFFEILKKLVVLNLLDYEVTDFYDTKPGEIEFFVSLRKVAKSSEKQQLKSIPHLTPEPTNEELQVRLAEYEQQIHAVLTSTSWRITKPFRKIVQKLSGKS